MNCVASSVLAALLILSSIAPAQTAPTGLNPEQKSQFDEATQAFGAKRNADALVIFKRLLSELPGNALVSKYASEAALNTGDAVFALNTLKPIAEANPNDPDVLLLSQGGWGNQDRMEGLVNAIRESEAIQKSMREAEDFIKRALEKLTLLRPGIERSALEDLARYITDRRI